MWKVLWLPRRWSLVAYVARRHVGQQKSSKYLESFFLPGAGVNEKRKLAALLLLSAVLLCMCAAAERQAEPCKLGVSIATAR